MAFCLFHFFVGTALLLWVPAVGGFNLVLDGTGWLDHGVRVIHGRGGVPDQTLSC